MKISRTDWHPYLAFSFRLGLYSEQNEDLWIEDEASIYWGTPTENTPCVFREKNKEQDRRRECEKKKKTTHTMGGRRKKRRIMLLFLKKRGKQREINKVRRVTKYTDKYFMRRLLTSEIIVFLSKDLFLIIIYVISFPDFI